MQGYTHTALVDTGIIPVGKAPHIVNPENLEYVVKSHTCFHIRSMPHRLCMRHVRESEQLGVVLRIIASAQMPPHSPE